MNVNLENFKPRLRAGRMIPHGSKFTFETQDSLEKITLPMIMADFILLCGGTYTIRQIVEKIYRKQGAVPFRGILETLYILHSRGFLENSSELPDQPWLTKQQLIHRRIYLDLRLRTTFLGPGAMPVVFYFLSLAITLASIPCFIFNWQNPFRISTGELQLSGIAILALFLTNSLILTGKQILRAFQILILNGRVSDFSLRIAPWAIYLRTSDTLIETENDRLFNFLFHSSQLLLPFGLIALVHGLAKVDIRWVYSLTLFLSFWEMSPFRRTEFFGILKALILPEKLDSLAFLGTGANPRYRHFIIVCSICGFIWIASCFKLLEFCVESYGAAINTAFTQGSLSNRIGAGVLIAIWFGTVYFSVHSFVETATTVVADQFNLMRLKFFRRMKSNSPPILSDEWIIETLRRLPIFAHLSDEALERLIAGSQLLRVEANRPIIVEGEESRNLYVLFDGRVVIQKGDAQAPILPITIFGESALLERGIRSANVVAAETSSLLKIPVTILRQVARDSHVIGEIEGFMTAIMVDQFFASAPLFRKLPREGIDYLSSRGILEFTSPGQVIFNQGDPGEAFYMLIRGRVRVEVNGRSVKHISQGGFFGEISLIANVPRTASIISDEPSVLFKISADAFWESLVQHIELAVFIEKVSEQRLREDMLMMGKTG